MSRKDKRLVYIYLGLAVLVLILIGLFRDSIFGPGDTGQILINDLGENTVVFLDNQEAKRVNRAQESVLLKKIDPGFHSILISREGFWPWLKDIEVSTGETTVLSPFFALSNPSGLLVGVDDPEYDSLVSQINSMTPPAFETKKVSADEKMAIWVDGSTLFAEWLGEDFERPPFFCDEGGCHNVIVPLGVGAEIRSVEFYKNRNDVFLVSFGSGVFAIEADNTGNNQNFQPIFEGGAPNFIIFDENSIYVLNGEALMQVAI